MSETPSQPCATPARRRQPRNPGRSGAQKAYASENDAVNLDPSRYDGNPSTPRKDYDSPGPQGTQNGSKQRSRKQPRPVKNNNNQPTSPESGRPGRQTTPPQTATKPGSLSAFAGATFHASPAPSALPLPSFLSRTSTESPSFKTNDVAQEPSPPTDTEAPTPSHRSSGPVSQDSPLDFMFRAHRQEIERKRRESSTGPRPTVPNIASPLAYSPFEPRSLPKPSNLPQNNHNHPQTQPRYRPSGIASDELDGTPGRPILPAFATPYQERMKAARSNSTRSAPVQQASQQASQQATQQPAKAPTDDPTEALKRFLFSGPNPSGPSSAPNSYPSGHYTPAQPNNTPLAAPVPSGSQENRPNNIRAMEDDLRRILKLDHTPSRAGHEQSLFS